MAGREEVSHCHLAPVGKRGGGVGACLLETTHLLGWYNDWLLILAPECVPRVI